MQAFWLCFVPLFVATGAFGILPLFITLTEGSDTARPPSHHSPIGSQRYAGHPGLCAGRQRFSASAWYYRCRLHGCGRGPAFHPVVHRVDRAQRTTQVASDSLGAVPLGVPLLAGPAVLTTSVLLGKQYGRTITIAA
jgi:multiple antibiotic resistance protein